MATDMREKLVQSAEEAAAAADRLGFPIVLKVQSPQLPHKTEAGGVRLNLLDQDAVTHAYTAMLADVMRLAPDATIDGVLVQRMRRRGMNWSSGWWTIPPSGRS